MSSADWTDVRFDYDGSLELARRLWQLADHVLSAATARDQAALDALDEWAGPLCDEFRARNELEAHDLHRISAELRATAAGWAGAWAHAINLQNRRLFARACSIVRDRRSLVSRAWGAVVGHHDLPPEPYERAVPVGPAFAPTGGFAHYSVLS